MLFMSASGLLLVVKVLQFVSSGAIQLSVRKRH
jgi:hypothetical protein